MWCSGITYCLSYSLLIWADKLTQTRHRQLLSSVLCGGEMDPLHAACAMQCMCLWIYVCMRVWDDCRGKGARAEKEEWAGGVGGADGEIVAALKGFFECSSQATSAAWWRLAQCVSPKSYYATNVLWWYDIAVELDIEAESQQESTATPAALLGCAQQNANASRLTMIRCSTGIMFIILS